MNRVLLILFLAVIFQIPSPAQNLSTEGTDFWFGFMDNWLQSSGNPIILEVYISADDTTEGVLEMPLVNELEPIEFTVIPGITTLIELPSELAEAEGSRSLENKGIHISTDKDVSVYAMNKRQYSADVAVILPTFSLSNNYLVMAHWEDGNRNDNDNSDSEFLIVGIEDNTEIEITPSVFLEGGGTAGVPFTITLDQGQTYQVQARADLTGTKIVGLDNPSGECNNFAVFAGNQYTKVGTCNHPDGHDHLFAQMYPIKTWGTDYVVVDFETRFGGDVVKVLASEDNTQVNISGENVTLDEGEFAFRRLEGVNVITSDKPVAVGQFSRSQGCDGTRGDPFFIMISPDQQLLRSITFNAPTIATVTNYSLNVITPTSDVANVRFDGASIENLFQPVPGNPSMSYARVITFSGDHTLVSEEGFIAYIYGYGNNESFGYATGAGLANLSLGVNIRNQIGVAVPTDSICLHDISVFAPVSSFDFDTYRYDFGDGTVIVRDDETPVPHQYTRTGTYVFRLTGLDDQDNCSGGGSEETEVKVIKVINPTLQVRGPRSVCPNTPGVEYFVENNIYFDNVWSVEGGTLVSASNDSIVVDWGETSSQASVKLVSTNRYDCNGDTVIFPVRINIMLEPEAPFGPDSLCASAIQDIEYYTYFTQGSVYDWKIENGEIVSGQGTHEISVNWFGAGFGKLWFDQMAQTDTICDGTSDSLTVFIQRVPDPIASISSEKNVYQVEEPVRLNFQADPLFQLARVLVNGSLFADSMDIDMPLDLSFECSGVYDFRLEAFDTVGICPDIGVGDYSITVLDPLVEIIHVTHDLDLDSTLNTTWGIQYADYKSTPFILQRVEQGRTFLETIRESSGLFRETGLNTNVQRYSYQISDTGPCINGYSSRIHTSIVLSVEPGDENELNLAWSDYDGWEFGVEQYEIERSVDEGTWEPVALVTENFFTYPNDTLGFDYCFRIRAIEDQGNLSYAYSNTACGELIPPLYPYNLITPNDDGLNDQFVIESIELYPNSKLTIFNRWGRIVLEQRGYQNDWEGTENGKDLSSGVYYYVLDLNEPRVEQQRINGIVSIVR